MNDSNIVLELQNISFQTILNDVNIKLKKGEIYCIIGNVGSGKSLLLKIAAGLFDPSVGDVCFQNELLYSVTRHHRLKLQERIGFLFQNTALISNMNVYDNLALVLRYHTRLKESEIKDKVEFFLNKFELIKKINSMPSDLTMGEKKLTGIARSVVNDPDILILDEPTNHLDLEMIEWLEA